ncbi:MAG TPA: STAS domain-containing protein [Candidatus Acidoferrales bacterium]|jgi:anti-anti-sigma factor|nr:STAS domain-containing protein [Candidatus Acidoferrales bacterium]
MPEFTIEKLSGSEPGIQILKLAGPFTLSGVFEFQEIVRGEASPGTVIDLADVPYMDSAALGSLLGLHVSCQKHNRKYALANASDRLKTLFRVAGVESLLVICPSQAEAEAKVGASAASA